MVNNISNCSWCKEPLNFPSNTVSFPCNHQLHKGCLVGYVDQVDREKHEALAIPCPDCSKVTSFPSKQSAECIVSWVATASRVRTATTIAFWGMGMGGYVHTQTFLLPASFVAGGCAVSGLIPTARIQQLVTRIYNHAYKTSIDPTAVNLYHPSNRRVEIVYTYVINKLLFSVIKSLSHLTFHEEDQSLINELKITLEELANNDDFAAEFVKSIQEPYQELHSTVQKLNCQLFLRNGFLETLQQVERLCTSAVFAILKNHPDLQIDKPEIAIRIGLVKSLAIQKKLVKSPELKNILESPLIQKIQQQLKDRSPPKSLIEILYSNDFQKNLFQTLQKFMKASARNGVHHD